MFCIYSLQDNGNLGAGNLTPLGLFFVIFGIGACFGWETGYAINLARDFGPRLMSYCLGYGHEVWSAGNYYFWVPMVAPFFGCLFGGWLYDVFIFTGSCPPRLIVSRLTDRQQVKVPSTRHGWVSSAWCARTAPRNPRFTFEGNPDITTSTTYESSDCNL